MQQMWFNGLQALFFSVLPQATDTEVHHGTSSPSHQKGLGMKEKHSTLALHWFPGDMYSAHNNNRKKLVFLCKL